MEEWIIDIWSDFSSFERIVFITLFVFFIVYNIKEYIIVKLDFIENVFSSIKNVFKKIFRKNNNVKEHKKTKEDILKMVLNHDIMTIIKRIETEYDNKDFGGPVKNKIFRLVLTTYLETIKEKFISIATDYDIEELEQSELKNLLFGTLLDIINDSNKKLKLELGNDIYNLIMLDPIKGFRKWEEYNNNLEWGILNDIDWGVYLGYLNSNHKILLFIMETKSITLQVLSNGFEKRFNQFNGELDELIKKYDWK
jgi:hypothetical protein